MKIPTLEGVIRRRLLLNYRVKPEVMEGILPANFRPKLVRDHAIAGICLIRLEKIRPKGFPSLLGIASENSAHRIAVEWDEDGERVEGVFVPRRDTSSRINALAGGRLFPGVHHYSDFKVSDQEGRISMEITAPDLEDALVEVEASETGEFPEGSIFESLEESSRFFENGCVGYSSRPDSSRLDGLQLKIAKWEVSPLDVQEVSSAYFDDQSLFPQEDISFDHGLLMRNVPHEWHSEPEMSQIQR